VDPGDPLAKARVAVAELLMLVEDAVEGLIVGGGHETPRT